jgi:ketosteroid isomerase-like protein
MLASHRGADTLRSFYELWNSGDVDALTELFDPDAEVCPALSTFLGSTVYRGRAGVADWFAETNEPWAELRVQPERFVESGDRVLGMVRLVARSPGSRVDVDAEIAHIATLRDGLIVRLDGYDRPGAAMAAFAET